MEKINLKGKRILVTGGNGYLGKHLIYELMKRGAIIFCIDISKETTLEVIKYYQVDLRDKERLNEVIKEIQPKVIYHLAACLDRRRNFDNTERIFDINLKGTINLLNSLREVRYENFVFTSTSEVYGGKHIKAPFNEDDQFVPASPYSLSKYCAEMSIKTFSEIYQKNYTILRLFNFYGPGMPNQFFIPKLISALKNNENFNMTKGEQIRDFLFISDIIHALILATESNAYQEIFNVCSGDGVSIKELALKIKGKLKSVSKINFGAIPYRKNEVWEMVGDNSKLINNLGFHYNKNINIQIKSLINEKQKV